jgi:hypothetical protein
MTARTIDFGVLPRGIKPLEDDWQRAAVHWNSVHLDRGMVTTETQCLCGYSIYVANG